MHYANHVLKYIKGSIGLNGSSISESKHYSVLSNLNQGEKRFNTYCETPIVLVKDLFVKQSKFEII